MVPERDPERVNEYPISERDRLGKQRWERFIDFFRL